MANYKKGQRRNSFVMLTHQMLNHENYCSMSTRAKALLVDITAQYRGSNNGDLCATSSVLKLRGWNSNDQIKKGLDELIARGFLVLTRQGRRPRVPSLYAVTWQGIDDCGGKLEEVKPNPVPLNLWKDPARFRFSDPRHTVQTEPPHGAMEGGKVVPLNRHTVHKRAK